MKTRNRPYAFSFFLASQSGIWRKPGDRGYLLPMYFVYTLFLSKSLSVYLCIASCIVEYRLITYFYLHVGCCQVHL